MPERANCINSEPGAGAFLGRLRLESETAKAVLHLSNCLLPQFLYELWLRTVLNCARATVAQTIRNTN